MRHLDIAVGIEDVRRCACRSAEWPRVQRAYLVLERLVHALAGERPAEQNDERRVGRRLPQVGPPLQRHQTRHVRDRRVVVGGQGQAVAGHHREPPVVVGAGQLGVGQVHLTDVRQRGELTARREHRLEGRHVLDLDRRDLLILVQSQPGSEILGDVFRLARPERGAVVVAQLGFLEGQQREPGRVVGRVDDTLPGQRAAAEHDMRQAIAEGAIGVARRETALEISRIEGEARRYDLDACLLRLRDGICIGPGAGPVLQLDLE